MSLVQRFMTRTYKVTRSKKGTYVKGRYIPGPTETIKVDGSLQPSTARELKLPDEGNRLRQVFKFYTDKPVVTNNTKTLADADKVEINGESFKAMALTPWQGTDLDYFMTAVWREPEQ